ncbi:hypothetical protein [Roseivivax halodurans]|nr:hypothetical protein [Roseivivax halodurans]
MNQPFAAYRRSGQLAKIGIAKLPYTGHVSIVVKGLKGMKRRN